MNKIITKFEKFNESKHAHVFAEAKEMDNKDNSFFDEGKQVLSDAKTLKIKDAETKSFFSKLKEDIDDLSKSINDKHKSNTKLAMKRVKDGIKNCKFK